MWHIYDSQGHILALTLMGNSLKRSELSIHRRSADRNKAGASARRRDRTCAKSLSTYTLVDLVVYDFELVPRRAIFSPRETLPEINFESINPPHGMGRARRGRPGAATPLQI